MERVTALQPIIVTRGTCLRLHVWRCLLMAEVTLGSRVKLSHTIPYHTIPEAPRVPVPADGGGDPGVPGEALPVHHEDVAVLQPHPRHRPDKQYIYSRAVNRTLFNMFRCEIGTLAKIIIERWFG